MQFWNNASHQVSWSKKIDPAVLTHHNSLSIILADRYAANGQEKTELPSFQIALEQNNNARIEESFFSHSFALL